MKKTSHNNDPEGKRPQGIDDLSRKLTQNKKILKKAAKTK